MKKHPRLLRITTLAETHKVLLNGQLGFFKQKKYKVMAVSADGPETLPLSVEGIPHQAIPFKEGFDPWNDLVCLVQLLFVIHDFKPDIVHTHSPKAGLIGMLASRIMGIPVRLHTVSRLPDWRRGRILEWFYRLGEKITYACATRIYPNSQGLRKIVEREYGFTNKTSMIASGSSNGIDTRYYRRTPELEKEAFLLRSGYGIRDNDLVICYAGPLIKEKGINELVDAFVLCRERFRSPGKVFLMVIGPMEDHHLADPDLLQFLTDDPGVILAGYQPELRPWLMASDLFVFPSHREGFANVLLQASSLGVPCIVTDIAGSNEVVKANETGLVVRPGDAESLALAIEYLAGNESLRMAFGAAARERIVEYFDNRRIWNALYLEYEHHLAIVKELKKGHVPNYIRFGKPLLDRLVAMLAVILTSPLWLACIVALAVANKGKVFFTQKRPGRDGRLFTLLKFRTMTDARDTFGQLLPDTARITPVGKFIRKTSLDELPQLVNVLLGDMSIVGPRPLLEEYLPLYSEDQMRRHLVKPGITGWAQVNGRNATTWQERFSQDLWYVKHQSFKLDLKILALTLRKVFRAEGINNRDGVTMERFTGNPPPEPRNGTSSSTSTIRVDNSTVYN